MGPPPCDPIQVVFPVLLLSLHTRVQMCKGARDCGGGKWTSGEVGGGCRVGLWNPPPPCDPIQVLFSLFCMGLHARVQTCKGARDCGGGIKGDGGRLGGGCRVGLWDPPHVTPLRFSLQCSVWACTRVCKRARAQGIVGGDKGMWGKWTSGEVGGGCRVGLWNPPPM